MGEGDQGQLIKRPAAQLIQLEAEIEARRADVEAARERFVGLLDDFQEEVEETLDWRHWVRERPWHSVGLAFALGFLLGSS